MKPTTRCRYCQKVIEHLWELWDHVRCAPVPRTPSGRRWTAEEYAAIPMRLQAHREQFRKVVVRHLGRD